VIDGSYCVRHSSNTNYYYDDDDHLIEDNRLKDRSKKAVYAALFGNLGIALSKLIAAILTGSIALWAETLHSFSDTINQILILIGIKTSSKAASERHPFGHGKEQFF